MNKLKIAYFGTPYFSARFLEKLLTDSALKKLVEVKFVVTQPDAAVGRRQILTPSPVKQVAMKHGVEVFEIDNWKIKNSLKIENCKLKIKACDMALLYAYGALIPNDVLNLPRLGFLNTHPSLLPKYRGSGPISYPPMLGDTKTGVTLIKLDEKIDHGPIIAQEELEIGKHDKRSDLEIKLTDLAFNMFIKFVNSLTRQPDNKLIFEEQDHEKATFTRKLTKQDGYIPFEVLKNTLSQTSKQSSFVPQISKDYDHTNSLTTNYLQLSTPQLIYNFYRGLFPWPGIWTQVRPTRSDNGPLKRLKITDLALENDKLVIKKVQLEGKNEVDFKTFQKAYKVF